MVNPLDPPMAVVATWPEPNYVNPEDRGPTLFILSLLFSIIGIFLVSARVYSRLFLTRAPGGDDVLIVFGCLFTVALSTLVAVADKKYYTGRHIWDVPIEAFAPHRLNVWICEWMYLAAASSIKISILLFYRRLSVSFSKWFLWATWLGIAYNVLLCLGFVVCLLTICRPLEAWWKAYDITWASQHYHEFHCATEQVTLPLSGGLSVIGDLYATVLPMVMIYSTVRNPSQKWGLYILFGLGFLSVVVGAIRTYLMNRLINVEWDFLRPLYYMWICTILELTLGLAVASAPALRPLFRKYVMVPVSKAKTSTLRSATTKSHRTWNSAHPWSHTSASRESHGIDLEKVGIACGFPEEIHPGTHSAWADMRYPEAPQQQRYEMQYRRHSKLISFPEELPLPAEEEIAVAR